MPRTALLATVLACCAAPALAQQEGLERRATFIDTEGAEIGAVRMISTPNGVLFALDLQGLPPDSWHGFHVHETGECDPQTGFKSAGGHYNIADTPHGYHSVGGPHAGDMPNQYAGPEGRLRSEVINPFVFLGGEGDNLTGRALIVHSGPDDHASQPSGEAGDRLACAVVE